MRSEAATVDEYLAELPRERQAALDVVRAAVLDNLATGFEEAMNWGMIAYQIPLATYPQTYNGQPLLYAGLASQKNHMAVYLSGVYGSSRVERDFIRDYQATGRKLDMGKSCVRFKRLEDLPVEVIGAAIAAYDVDSFIAHVEAARA